MYVHRAVLGVVAVLVLGICVVNGLLLVENDEMHARLDDARGGRDFAPGDQFEGFAAFDLDGRRAEVRVREETRKTLLLVVSTVCPACQANFPALREMASALDPEEWSVVWVSRDPWSITEGYFAERPVDGVVLSEPSYGVYMRLGMRTVPRTFVLAPGGELEFTLMGRLTEDQVRQLAAAVGLDERADQLAANLPAN